MSDNRVTITMTDGTTREVHPDTIVRSPNGLIFRASATANGGYKVTAIFEPTREDWVPYEPWMRDVLADDARVSWVGPDLVYRATWSFLDLDNTGWNLDHKVRVHPDDVPERPTERRVNVTITDVYAAPDEHGFLRINVGPETAVIDQDATNVTVTDVPERPTEDRDVKVEGCTEPTPRALICTEREADGHREVRRLVLTTYQIEDDPALLRDSDGADLTPDAVRWLERFVELADESHPAYAGTPGRPAEDDPDEALARAIFEVHCEDAPDPSEFRGRPREVSLRAARVAREHIDNEPDDALVDSSQQVRAEEAEADVERLTRERDEAMKEIRRLHYNPVAQEMRRQRDKAVKRHAALREDVDEFQYKHREHPGTWELVDALARDTERGQA